MRRAASTLKTITPARSFASFGPPPVFEEGVKKLEEKGIKYAQHVGMSNADSNPKAGKCPMLNHNKDLMYSVMNESNGRGYVRRYPLSIAKAQGVTLTDTEGREYLDCLGCAGTLALGHNHPVTVKAIRDFLDSGAPLQVLDMATPYKMEFMKELKSVMPEELSRLHFCSPAGTDCLDAAVKLCKTATGRSSVLSFHGGYHGMGQSTMAMMGNLGCKTPVSGLMPEVYFLPYPYEYRNPFGMNGEEGDRAVMKYIETVLNDDESGITKPACVVVEAIQGEGGVHAMSDWCLQELRRITKKFDVPLVIDEVQAGFCRSGNIFAYEKSGIVPDVVCMSKAVGGSMPMAVIGFTEELDKWAPASHTGTFRGNQLSFATGTASLKYMKENRLWEKVAKQGEHLHARVSKLQQEVNTIGNIRGRGLMWGVEMVNDKKGVDHSGIPLPDGDLAAEIQLQCYRRGMLMEKGGRAGAVMRFLCPLIISDEELDRALDIFEECVKVAEEKLYK